MSGFTWKRLTPESLQTSIEAMREHLIAKNVAADVAEKICQSILMKLSEKTFETFESLTTSIRQAMRDTLMMILTPKPSVDILRDIADAQKAQRPYVITFCGVNGVGKSTNLTKVWSIFWFF
jgi:signal recognition particle receptor subunit alpha